MEPADEDSGRNKRARYRVDVQRGAPINVSVVGEDRLVACELTDISSTGCGFLVARRDARDWEEGGVLDLRFTASGQGHAVATLATLHRLQQLGGRVSVGVEFLDLAGLYSQLTARTWVFFNRRRAYRVTPLKAPGTRVEVSLSVGRGVHGVLLQDLTALGLGLRLSPGQRLILPEGAELAARFELPALPRALDLAVTLVHRTTTPEAEVLGLEYDPGATAEFEEQSTALVGYVLELQRRLLARSD